MDVIERAQRRYRELVPDELVSAKPAERARRLPASRIEAWITNYVIPAIEEVNLFTADGRVVHFSSPKVQASIAANTYVVTGQAIGTVGATSNGRFPGMRPHLHFEVRERTQKGLPPFPGRPYRSSSRDPEHWLRAHDIIYNGCGRLANAP